MDVKIDVFRDRRALPGNGFVNARGNGSISGRVYARSGVKNCDVFNALGNVMTNDGRNVVSYVWLGVNGYARLRQCTFRTVRVDWMQTSNPFGTKWIRKRRNER